MKTTRQAAQVGITFAKERPILISLYFLVHAVAAYLVATPLFHGFSAAIGRKGWSTDLIAQFDWLLMRNVVGESSGAIAATFGFLIPVLGILWVVRLGMRIYLQLPHRDQGAPSLATIVRTLPTVVLTYIMVIFMAGVGTTVLGLILSVIVALPTGEVAGFWSGAVLIPTIALSMMAIAHLMTRAAITERIVNGTGMVDAALSGLKRPFTHGAIARLYFMAFMVSLVIIGVGFGIRHIGAASLGAAWGLFLLQQAVLWVRAFVDVAWVVGEGALLLAPKEEE